MDSSDHFQSTSMNPRAHRKFYLITYSQANRILYPTRESFGLDVVEAFNQGLSKIKVLHWACCLESHQNGGGPLPCGSQTFKFKKMEKCKGVKK